ncbi:MAG: dTDP-4-dehydrorhamnose reductase [Aureliella sp.]
MQIQQRGSRENAGVPRFVILGASGMLGRAWTAALERNGIPFLALSRKHVDYTDPAELDRALGRKTDWVVNCSGYTDVDGAEREPHAAFESNSRFVKQLGDTCFQSETGVIHYSTDYVFDGRASQPYTTQHKPSPANVYGHSKAEGELSLLESGCKSLIIRTSWLFAAHGKNFLRTMMSLLRERDKINVVSDQIGRPTCVRHLVRNSLALINRQQTGIHHVTNGGQASWYEFAQVIGKSANYACEIAPCSTDEFPRPANRPAFSVLDLSRTEDCLGQMPDWRTSVQATVAELLGKTEPSHAHHQQNSALTSDFQLEPLS